jgi:hypothetical protein
LIFWVPIPEPIRFSGWIAKLQQGAILVPLRTTANSGTTFVIETRQRLRMQAACTWRSIT